MKTVATLQWMHVRKTIQMHIKDPSLSYYDILKLVVKVNRVMEGVEAMRYAAMVVQTLRG